MITTTINFIYSSVFYLISIIYFSIYLWHAVLPFGLDVALVGVGVYHFTKLRKPESDDVKNIFGPEPGTRESEQYPERMVRCIAHRGAGLDAPENTLEAFQYCVDRGCNFVEFDVRTSRDGKLVVLHDPGLERLAGSSISDIHVMDWDSIKNIDIGATHPNRSKYKEVYLCLLDQALDFLLANKVRMIIDIKGDDRMVIEGILKVFETRPQLYKHAAITCFNPLTLYQIRKKNPQIVGAISYRPYAFSAHNYEAETGPTNMRFSENIFVHGFLRGLDMIHDVAWRWSARWCAASAVLVHKDIVSPLEVNYWRRLGVRCAGWCVNRPVEKLYWRGVLRAPYLANTLVGEPEVETQARARLDRRPDLELE